METIDLNNKTKDVSWADYFDSLVDEAWREARKRDSRRGDIVVLKVQQPVVNGDIGVAKD